MINSKIEVANKSIQHDASGQGHAWRACNEDNLPADIHEEIRAEMIDGKVLSCPDYVASNGQHYRW